MNENKKKNCKNCKWLNFWLPHDESAGIGGNYCEKRTYKTSEHKRDHLYNLNCEPYLAVQKKCCDLRT